MTDYTSAQRRLMLASFALGQAQRQLEEAEQKFQEALTAVEIAEAAAHADKPALNAAHRKET